MVMTAFLVAFAAILALGIAANLLAAAGWPAWLGLLVAIATFGGDPTDPLRAVLYGGVALAVLHSLRRAL